MFLINILYVRIRRGLKDQGLAKEKTNWKTNCIRKRESKITHGKREIKSLRA